MRVNQDLRLAIRRIPGERRSRFGGSWRAEGLGTAIGVDRATGQATDLFTESSSGILWFSKGRALTLGQLFLEWGQPIGDCQIGSMHCLPDRAITWYVDGAAVPDPASVVLHDHDEIRAWYDEQGAPVAPVSSFSWPPGYSVAV